MPLYPESHSTQLVNRDLTLLLFLCIFSRVQTSILLCVFIAHIHGHVVSAAAAAAKSLQSCPTLCDPIEACGISFTYSLHLLTNTPIQRWTPWGHRFSLVDYFFQFSSVTQLCLTFWSRGLQHTRLPCPSPTSESCSNSRPLSRWCHPTISFSVIPFSSCLQSFSESAWEAWHAAVLGVSKSQTWPTDWTELKLIISSLINSKCLESDWHIVGSQKNLCWVNIVHFI